MTIAIATNVVNFAHSLTSITRTEKPKRSADISNNIEDSLSRLEHYRGKFGHINGSFWDGAIVTWDILLERQSDLNIDGDIIEIGVLKGKSATLLALHAADEETFVLVDPAMRNEATSAVASVHPTNNVVIKEFSQNIRHHPALKPKGFRWIHIDGEHSGPAVVNDLEIAAKLLTPRGIICLDDFFTPAYPQITAATFAFLADNPQLTLFLVGYNKGYICHSKSSADYLAFLRDNAAAKFAKRQFPVTLWKSAAPPDLNCFGVTPKVQNTVMKGPDWAPNEIPI